MLFRSYMYDNFIDEGVVEVAWKCPYTSTAGDGAKNYESYDPQVLTEGWLLDAPGPTYLYGNVVAGETVSGP